MSENKNDLIRETAEEHLYTFADYLKWNDGKRYELIDGQVYILAPAPSLNIIGYPVSYTGRFPIIYWIRTVRFLPLLLM